MEFALAAILVATLSPVLADGGGCTNDPAEVEAFAASYYTAILVNHDADMLNLTKGGDEAGMMFFKVVKQCLEEHQQCNADSVAYTFGQALARTGTAVTMQDFFKHTAYTLGRSLFKYGILNCSNAIALSFEQMKFGYAEYFKYTRDAYNLDMYMHDMVYSLVDMFQAHGQKLEEFAQEIADIFYDSYGDEKLDCKFVKPSN